NPQPPRRGFKLGHTDIKAAPHALRQALPALLPGHPNITPPRSTSYLQQVVRLVHQIVRSTSTQRNIPHFMSTPMVQPQPSNRNGCQFDQARWGIRTPESVHMFSGNPNWIDSELQLSATEARQLLDSQRKEKRGLSA